MIYYIGETKANNFKRSYPLKRAISNNPNMFYDQNGVLIGREEKNEVLRCRTAKRDGAFDRLN